jgi:hypothetical protein
MNFRFNFRVFVLSRFVDGCTLSCFHTSLRYYLTIRRLAGFVEKDELWFTICCVHFCGESDPTRISSIMNLKSLNLKSMNPKSRNLVCSIAVSSIEYTMNLVCSILFPYKKTSFWMLQRRVLCDVLQIQDCKPSTRTTLQSTQRCGHDKSGTIFGLWKMIACSKCNSMCVRFVLCVMCYVHAHYNPSQQTKKKYAYIAAKEHDSEDGFTRVTHSPTIVTSNHHYTHQRM